MLLSTLAGLNRKDGKLVILAQAAHILSGGDVSKVTRAYQTLLGNTDVGAKQRAQFSHVLFVVDNQARASHEFPDVPALVEQSARAHEITAAAEAVAAIKAKLAAAQEASQALRAEVVKANEQARAAGLEEIPLPDDADAIRVEFMKLEAELERLRPQAEGSHPAPDSPVLEELELPVGDSPLVPS